MTSAAIANGAAERPESPAERSRLQTVLVIAALAAMAAVVIAVVAVRGDDALRQLERTDSRVTNCCADPFPG